MSCPLCESPKTEHLYEKNDPHWGLKKYRQCPRCCLTFLEPQFFLNPEEEKSRYDLHHNDPADQGYVKFLDKLIAPLSRYLAPGYRGLDFGCGPGPTASGLLSQQGFVTENYDPFYFPDQNLLNNQYDFVISTETIEHFFKPRKEFLTLKGLLRGEGSILALMTEVKKETEAFDQWWYHSEPTHVCFYHQRTFQWLSQWLELEVIFNEGNVFIFQNKREQNYQ